MTDELPPIRCVTCNKILGNLWQDYQQMLEQGTSIEIALNKLGLRRPCCRLRLMNPIKVVDIKSQQQSDIDRLFENNFESLSISYSSDVNTTGALSAMTEVTGMTIIPEDEDEEDDYDLPPILSLPTSKDRPNRTYSAW